MISLKVSVFSSIFLFSFTGFAANESIHAASNVSAGRAVLQISGNVRSLVAINLTDAKVSTIKWPETIQQEEVMAMVNTPSALVVISQWTSGDGKIPHVNLYEYSKSKWSTAGELSCRSFDTVTLKKNLLSVDCEADPLTKVPQKKINLKLPETIASQGKWEFPITHSEEKEFSMQLEGPTFEWNAVQVHSSKLKTKTLKVSELKN